MVVPLFVGGNMRSIDENFYKTKSWLSCKQAYMNHVNGLCEICFSKNRIVPAKIVHHKIHMNSETVKDDSLAYGFDNLQAVCLACHNDIHFGKKEPKRYEVIEGVLVIGNRDEARDSER